MEESGSLGKKSGNLEKSEENATSLRGRFFLKIDSKGRFHLPTSLKKEFENQTIVVTNSQYQGGRCLDIYFENEWKKLEDRVQKMSTLKKEVQAFQRFYIAGGQPVEGDSQGRVLVPRGLRDYANLQDQVVLVGMGNKFELWNDSNWKTIFEKLATNFEDTLSMIEGL